ncbi:hypothetical protein [Staphylococcus sp. IVB6240]|uniref:hypothetical protein n=1 Tax=Staphylococcus sp. IVB6240 TaxID=2989771 RepID=UPI0021CDF34C|nr:hypothetical protein [Staphylococcus sp. IVB6240]UXR70924.1 hypothetical protein MUA88_06780 [Staphylococcus sp. IVB6240]
MKKKDQKLNSKYQNQAKNMDFAVSFIAGTLIGSAVGYAIKPFVNRAVDYTQEHELTNFDKQTKRIRQEAQRKADDIKVKAQQIKEQALGNSKDDSPSNAEREAQKRAIKQEIDSDKLEAPKAATYHFTAEKDKPVSLSELKARPFSGETSEVKAAKKEETSVSSLAAMRQAMAVDKTSKAEDKPVVEAPKAAKKEETSVSSLAAMRQAMAADKTPIAEEKTVVEAPKAAKKEETSVSSLAAMRQAMAADKTPKVEEKAKTEQPKTQSVEQRNPQTHREARFENGVITHEAAKSPKKPVKKQTKKASSNTKKTTNNKATAKKRNSKVEKHTFKK